MIKSQTAFGRILWFLTLYRVDQKKCTTLVGLAYKWRHKVEHFFGPPCSIETLKRSVCKYGEIQPHDPIESMIEDSRDIVVMRRAQTSSTARTSLYYSPRKERLFFWYFSSSRLYMCWAVNTAAYNAIMLRCNLMWTRWKMKRRTVSVLL